MRTKNFKNAGKNACWLLYFSKMSIKPCQFSDFKKIWWFIFFSFYFYFLLQWGPEEETTQLSDRAERTVVESFGGGKKDDLEQLYLREGMQPSEVLTAGGSNNLDYPRIYIVEVVELDKLEILMSSLMRLLLVIQRFFSV